MALRLRQEAPAVWVEPVLLSTPHSKFYPCKQLLALWVREAWSILQPLRAQQALVAPAIRLVVQLVICPQVSPIAAEVAAAARLLLWPGTFLLLLAAAVAVAQRIKL